MQSNRLYLYYEKNKYFKNLIVFNYTLCIQRTDNAYIQKNKNKNKNEDENKK